jgi:hypothetical protein
MLNQFVWVSIVVLFFSILLVYALSTTTSFAELSESEINSVNNISLRAIFHFRAGDEEITTFSVFNQLNGYEKTASPRFELHGIVDGSKQLLHEATDAIYHDPSGKNQYSEFDVDIYLSDEAATNIHFSYQKCDIEDYFVETLFDKEETYNRKTKFAYVEHFEIECSGYHPLHLEESLVTSEDSKITSSMDKEHAETWEDYFP